MTFARRSILVLALLGCAGSTVFAADFIVTTTADTVSGTCGASCSLRDAIIAANLNPGPDRIVLGSGLTYTLTLGPADPPGTIVPTSGDLDITDALTIEGNGSTIDAAGLDRVLHIEGVFSVVINDLTIRGGVVSGFLTPGAGVFIKSATVTFNNCTVTANSIAVLNGVLNDGGGIAAIGTFDAPRGVATPAVLTLNNTTVSGNTGGNGGGVVCVLCQLTTSNTTFVGNTSSAGDGAGLTILGNASTASITQGTFTGNTGASRGGAIAIPVGTSVVGITRARILGNAALLASGIFNDAAAVTATNNWWGCNAGPGAAGAGCAVTADTVSGPMTASPFLVLQANFPVSIAPSNGATITADLTGNSAGLNVSAGGTLHDGIPAAFSATLGAFAQATVALAGGKASDLFTAGPTGGSAALAVTVDNQTVSTALPIVLPQLTTDRTSLTFAATTNGSAFLAQTGMQTVHLTQAGVGPITWTAVSNEPWLIVSPASGSGSAALNVSVQFEPGLASTQGGAITLTVTGAANTPGPIGVTLNTLAAPPAPFGSFDTPKDGSTGLAGSIGVTGWALDAIEVMSVTICRDAVAPESAVPDARCNNQGKIFIGTAVFVDGARPDVQATFPNDPFSSRAGWGYLLLTNVLPNSGDGTYTLYAYATNTAGQTTPLGSRTISCANSASQLPFGAIDTPTQGDTVSGAGFANFGWVLARAPSFADPTDGGTVNVFIDGALVGSPAGWAARPDLTALFPAAQYPGIGSALGVFTLDTTTLANGLHTIAWSSTSNTGFTAGIASHYFTVANGALMLNARAASPAVSRVVAAAPPAAASLAAATLTTADVDALPPDDTAVAGRRGFDVAAPLQPYDVVNGSVTVHGEELDRIELQFGATTGAAAAGATNGAVTNATGGATSGRSYAGYLRKSSGLSPLPVGSQFDGAAGVFVWQPGVGFVGAYQLVFVRLANGQPVAKTEVRIILNPKRTGRVGAQTVIDAPAAPASGGSPAIVSASGFAVTGWASDFNSTIDNGVDVVHAWAYRVDGLGSPDPAFLGPALVDGNRPDVGALYGARFARSGYGLVVNSLAPGTYDIAVFAYSTVSNSFAPAQTVRVVVK